MALGGQKTGRALQRANEDREAGLCLTLPADRRKDMRSILTAISIHGSVFPASAQERGGCGGGGTSGEEMAGLEAAASEVSPADGRRGSLTHGTALWLHTVFRSLLPGALSSFGVLLS